MSALVGTEKLNNRRNLASDVNVLSPKVDTLFLDATVSQTTPLVSPFLTPTVLFGVALGLILTFGIVYAALQLFDIQTPYTFVEKGIDWGRIEK